MEAKFENYTKIFLEQNSKLNLISKNDEKFLWEKHILDSLSLEKFFEKYGQPKEILDIGTGGGFPAIPLAIQYPDIKITALDSIRKKINAVDEMKLKLGLENLEPICDRVENLDKKFDCVTSRAVASLDKISQYALTHLKSGGYFVAFKSRKVQEEIDEAQKVLKKYNAKVIDIIEYQLPLNEPLIRNLVVIKR